MQWVIRNTGNETIIGAGNDSQLLNNGLPLRFNNGNQILSISINNSNNNASMQDGCLWFQQWRVDEYVEITAFIENDIQPEIKISDRDIIDSEISYSIYSPESVTKQNRIIEYLPKWLGNTLRITYYISAVIIFLACIIGYKKNDEPSTKFGIILVFLYMITPLLWIIEI